MHITIPMVPNQLATSHAKAQRDDVLSLSILSADADAQTARHEASLSAMANTHAHDQDNLNASVAPTLNATQDIYCRKLSYMKNVTATSNFHIATRFTDGAEALGHYGTASCPIIFSSVLPSQKL